MLENIIQKENVEDVLIKILEKIHNAGPIDPEDIEKLAYIKLFNEEIFRKYEKKILYMMGLFYKVSKPEDFLEKMYAIYSEAIIEEVGYNLTPIQAEARRHIYKNRYYSFSAPTSAGKSYLYRRLIAECEGDILIVVPSRALIAEYMAQILELVDKDVLVLQYIENVNISNINKRIYIVTPERGVDIFSHIEELNIELVLLDEAQISEDEIRGLTFDMFVRRLDQCLNNVHMVFAHPFVNNPEAQLKKHKYNQKESAESNLYQQHTVGKIFLTLENDTFEYFSPYNKKWNAKGVKRKPDLISDILKNKGTVLIYVSKSKIISGEYIEKYKKYIDSCSRIQQPKACQLIEELKKYIGANEGEKYSQLLHMMEKGIVIHHGSMPLKARLIIEEFVRNNFARICFATSTLNQGINMPFDLVWIDNFRNMNSLTLKNLIGRAGRTTKKMNTFDLGYVVVNKKNRETFIDRLNEDVCIKEVSKLDQEFQNVSIDEQDLIGAMQTDSFNDEYKITDEQIKRLDSEEVNEDIRFILDNILIGNEPINGKQYYGMSNENRKELKHAFQRVYIRHLRRNTLTSAETAILSAAIPILLWHIQGKSFSEVVSLRYAYITENDKKRAIKKRIKDGEITQKQGMEEMRKIRPKYSSKAERLPNQNVRNSDLFKGKQSILDVDYDTVVYDTYDYLDKVISLSLAKPLCAAFELFATRENDERGMILANYIRYGTNDNTEIWMLKYGFTFEDIEWLKPYIVEINKNTIIFSDQISELDNDKLHVIERYIY